MPVHARDLSGLAGFTGAPDETLITPTELAALAGRSTVTLRTWAREGKGPKRLSIAGRPFY